MDKNEVKKLELMSLKIRRHIIEMLAKAGSGHPGGSLSSADIMTALYFGALRHDPKNPEWKERDRFHLSKGHACPALYAALAESGYFPTDQLLSLRKIGSILQGHPSAETTPGVDVSSGSLGHGLSVACGMAIAGKLNKQDYQVFCLLGDGEMQEGMIWEAAMFAAHYKLDNLVGIVDHNGMQIDGWIDDVMNLKPLENKWEAFGWKVFEVDGHSVKDLIKSFEKAKEIKGRPSLIVANTTKGKGVSFMEDNVEFHGRAPKPDETEKALAELDAELKKLEAK